MPCDALADTDVTMLDIQAPEDYYTPVLDCSIVSDGSTAHRQYEELARLHTQWNLQKVNPPPSSLLRSGAGLGRGPEWIAAWQPATTCAPPSL